MLKSQRLAVLPMDSYDLESELAVVDHHDYPGEYDALTFGSWSCHVLANGSGADSDLAFRPHGDELALTELGKRLPAVMSVVTDHFSLDRLQWVRIFALHDGGIVPHVDFLEFEEPGTRLQVPLRTSEESLHSENNIVYHLRRGEVWKIHTTDPHSAGSTSAISRLNLVLDYAGSEKPVEIRGDIPATEPVRIMDRPEPTEEEREELLDSCRRLTAATMRPAFRRFVETHFSRHLHAREVFDWYVEAARRSGDEDMVAKARAFRTYCIEKRSLREKFEW